MTRVLKLSADLSLPLEAVTEKLAFLGRTGSGKTYAAQKLAEELHRVGAQFIALDPVGKWWSLRLAADGESPGIEVPVFGGLHGDVPLEPTAGKLMADLVADRGISAVLDVSQFESDAAKNRFAKEFGERFFFRKKAAPSAVHLFLEEGQEFVPQNAMGDGDKQVLHVYTRMWKLGRNYGIGGSIITQRPQEVNKKVLNLTEILFAFQLTGPHERKAVAEWIKEKGLDIDVEALLPKLKNGEPHVWSPALLDISKGIRIGKKWTFDASSTPKVGAKAEAQTLAPIDLEKIRKDMAATIERAKAEDPKELRRRIAELERQAKAGIQKQPVIKSGPADIKVVEKPVLKDAQLARLEKIVEKVNHVGDQLITVVTDLGAFGKELAAAIRTAKNGHGPGTRHTAIPPSVKPALPVSRPQMREKNRQSVEGISRSQQRILDSLAWLESIGIAPADKTQLALLADQSPTSGGFFNNLGVLRTAGYIDYPAPAVVELTAAGQDVANPVDVPSTNEALHEQLFRKLSASQVRILRELIAIYPDEIAKDELAARAEQSATSGGYFNNLGRLRSLNLIDYPGPGRVVALPVLFLEGAR